MIPTEQPSGSSQMLRIDLPSTLMTLLLADCPICGNRFRFAVANYKPDKRRYSRQACQRSGHTADLRRNLPKQNEIRLNHHFALACCLSMIFSENRCPLFGVVFQGGAGVRDRLRG